MPAGRPLKFKTVEELEEKIAAYFADCDSKVIRRVIDKNGGVIEEITRPYTITGLALALDTSRETLIEYGERDEYVDTIRRAKLKCQNYVVEGALVNQLNSTFSIFNMKNNFGWKDAFDNNHSGGIPVQIVNYQESQDDNHSPQLSSTAIPTPLPEESGTVQDTDIPSESREVSDTVERTDSEGESY